MHHLRGDATGDADAYRDAIVHYERGLAIRRDLGDRVACAMDRLNVAQALLRLGQTQEARLAAREGLAEAVALHASRVVVFGLLVEADVWLALGDVEASLSLLGLIRVRPTAERSDQLEIYRILSRVDLEPSLVEAGLRAGEAIDFDTAVRDLLDGGAGPAG